MPACRREIARLCRGKQNQKHHSCRQLFSSHVLGRLLSGLVVMTGCLDANAGSPKCQP